MSIQLTDQQQAAVDNRGGELLVSAAAGSGKTRVLVERLLDRVEQEGLDVDQFLIITFTKAAAAELRGKILQGIHQRLAEHPGDRHLRRQLELVYKAQISTIHALCPALLREFGHLLDLDPDFRVAEEGEADLLRRETLDQVINSISGGAYKDTADFEARFIKGPKDETDGKYSLDGDAESVSFVCDFMNYMNRIDQAKADGQRTNYANGSVLFDFEEDFVSPLSFEGTYTAPVLQPLDDEDGEFQEFARSTVKDSFAYSTGGQSLSGKSAGASGTNASNNTLTSVTPAQESSALPEAAKEITEAAVGSTTEVLIESGAAYATDEGTVSESSSDEGADETASEIAAEGSSVEAATQADTAPAPEASSETAPEAASEAEAETSEPVDTAAETSSEGESASDNASESASESASEEEPEAAPAGETTQE